MFIRKLHTFQPIVYATCKIRGGGAGRGGGLLFLLCLMKPSFFTGFIGSNVLVTGLKNVIFFSSKYINYLLVLHI